MIPLYSRFLVPAEYGTIEILELATQILSLCFGLQSVGTALTRVFYDESSVEGKNRAASTTLWMTLAANLVLMAVVFPVAGRIGSLALHSDGYEWLIRASFFGLLLSTLVEVVLTYMRLRDRAVLFITYTLTNLVATAALNIWFIGFQGLGVRGFVYSKLIATGIGCIYLAGMMVREVGYEWSTDAASRMWRFGAPLIAANLAFFVIHFSDRFFLSATRSLDEVGTYSLAYRFAFLITVFVAEPFGRVWNVSLFSYTSNPGWELQFGRVARYLTVALCLACLALSLFGEIIIRLVSTPAYYPAASVLPILAFAYVAREIGDFYRNVLYINRRSGVVGAVAIMSAVTNLALNYALISRFGMFGAAWATLVTWAFYLLLSWAFARREHAIPFEVRSFGTAIGLAAAIYLMIVSLPRLPLFLELVSRFTWLAVFLLLLAMFRYFPKDELYFIRRRMSDGYEGFGKWMRART